MIDIEAVSSSIAATREGLAASNYSIDCADAGNGRLVFTVRAFENACEDCLVPKAIFIDLLKRELSASGIAATGIDVIYPLEDHVR